MAENLTGELIGYILVDVLDSEGHITQVTVHPDHQGRGIATALIEQAKTWTRGNGLEGITLATFSDVPWNRPLYEHLGFRVLDEEEIGPELRAGRDLDEAHGLGPEGRVTMRLELGGQ